MFVICALNLFQRNTDDCTSIFSLWSDLFFTSPLLLLFMEHLSASLKTPVDLDKTSILFRIYRDLVRVGDSVFVKRCLCLSDCVIH